MKYVYTSKIAPVETVYNAFEVFEATKAGLTKELHEIYPTPTDFVIPNGTADYDLTISASTLQLLAIWFNRGTRIHFQETYLRPACYIQTKRLCKQWRYDMVDSLPQAYIKGGYTTPQAAYDYGKKLIEACNKANLIPFEKLENAYKVIARNCMEPGHYIRIYSPNAKTIMEAQAELETAHTINSIFDTSSASEEAQNCPLSDVELQFFAKVFDIKMPEWFLRASNIRIDSTSAQGKSYFNVAVLPFVDATNFTPSVQFDPSGNIKTYDGNDFETKPIPTTYAKDAQPKRLENPKAERTQLAQQVLYYLNLPIEEQIEFMTSNYGYCTKCKTYFELRDGCTCGKHKAMTDEEYFVFMATRRAPTEYVDIREVRRHVR